jgi:deoxyribonuclease V
MYEHLIKLQYKLASRIIIKEYNCPIKYLAGIDVAFTKNNSVAAIVVLDRNLNVCEVAKGIKKTTFPYIPGLLSFREFPAIYDALKRLTIKPDIYIIDGQGIAHPRGLGLASHIGVVLNIVTIGCAKSKLYGIYNEPTNKRFSYDYLYNVKNSPIGIVLRTRENVKPVFISPGNNIDMSSSLNIIKQCTKKYRLPEPVRIAHYYAGIFKKDIE